MNITSQTEFDFGKIEAGELPVTDEEKALCRSWYEENILTADSAPAYDFKAGGKRLRKNLDDWDISVGRESAAGEYRRGGKTTFITLKHKLSDLTALVEATFYEEYATCEWYVRIKNEGKDDSPVISDFYAANTELATGLTTLYVSKGSKPSADDFELVRSNVSLTPMVFNANGGRSESFLPYFNLCGKNFGVIVTDSWTGQWYADLRQTMDGVKIRAKQEFFEGYLTSNEEVRSPLVSMTFYKNSNALKGFNTFRKWESDCVYTESAFTLTTSGLAGEFDRRGESEYIEQIKSMPDEMCREVDFLWRDAGWYKINKDWWDSVGNWSPDPERFPNGFAPIADVAEERGMKLLLWYEPERCCKDTEVYNECKKHDGWLIEQDDNVNMVNLAVDGACDYLGNLIAESIRDNKVALYRQDFNFTPLNMWLNADKELWGGRKGIEENHYVTNLYRYLDTLLEVNPGLIIDNCASGGKRLDVEMSRRSIPLWRTDYNCADSEGNVKADCVTASQLNSYGLSFWFPLTGTGLNVSGEYEERSLIVPCSQRPGYQDVRQYLDENYYPLTYGRLDESKYHAMQYSTENVGTALIYKREKVKSDTYKLMLKGLDPQKSYTVSDYDRAEVTFTKTGEELMNEGVDLIIPEAPKAEIIFYTVCQ